MNGNKLLRRYRFYRPTKLSREIFRGRGVRNGLPEVLLVTREELPHIFFTTIIVEFDHRRFIF